MIADANAQCQFSGLIEILVPFTFTFRFCAPKVLRCSNTATLLCCCHE
jgi:hypothetical protein